MEQWLELKFDIDCIYHPKRRQIVNWKEGIFEPEEPEELEIRSIKYNGIDMADLLSEADYNALYDCCMDEAREQAEENFYAADYEYERRKEAEYEYANGYHKEAA